MIVLTQLIMSHKLLVILNITKAIFIQNPHIGCVRDYTVLVTIGDLIEESKMDNSMVWSATRLDKLDNDDDCLQNCISNFRIYCLHLGRYTTETEYAIPFISFRCYRLPQGCCLSRGIYSIPLLAQPHHLLLRR